MQFLSIDKTTKLSQLSQQIGVHNVESVLHMNNVPRTPNVGQAFANVCAGIIQDTPEVTPQRKISILNTLTSDSDVYETAALTGGSGWKLLSSSNTLPGFLRIPDSITLPDSTKLLGNGIPVSDITQKAVTGSIKNPPYTVDPSIFNSYNYQRSSNIVDKARAGGSSGNPMQWFRIPWGDVTLYSSLNDESIDFPVYPEEMSNSATANYTTMPEMLYQYEPWQVYMSSGPRSQQYTFHFHRDMWTGDHRDGKANDLIRACMANCYPEYRGSAVFTSTVTLYIKGNALITGVLTSVNVDWSGPIGLDGFYLDCTMQLSITEVSPEPIDFHYMRQKPLIG